MATVGDRAASAGRAAGDDRDASRDQAAWGRRGSRDTAFIL